MIGALKKYLGWTDKTEIIVSAVGFPTSVAPILQNQMRPKFVDIQMSDLNFDLDKVEAAINKNTGAILVSPSLGNPPDMDRLDQLAKKHGIELVLDGCDSLGSLWDGKPLSSHAIASTCSFYPAHHITTGEGGMVSVNDGELEKVVRSLINWGRDCYCSGINNMLPNGTCGKRFSNWLPSVACTVDHRYVYSNVGYNLKPLDLQGSIGLVQIAKLPEVIRRRIDIKNRLQSVIEDGLAGFEVPDEHPKARTSWFAVPIVAPNASMRNEIVRHLESKRIQTRNFFGGNILCHPAYSGLDDFRKYPLANQVIERVFFLGCSPTLSEQMLKYVEETLVEFGSLHALAA
ncbi:MAG: DegT/DnrJ/EryC1/StrS family aminotransferase [Bdellovibrionota bacterium]